MWRTSDMFHAITRSSAASDAIGTYETMCARSRIEASTTAACTTAASGERAPARMLVAVRARAPVAAMPPKNGAAMLARPWPTSSASGSWRLPVLPSAMTAEQRECRRGHAALDERGAAARRPERGDLLRKAVRHAPHVEPEDVLQLQRGDHRGDAGREAGRHRMGDELDETPEARGAHRDQQHP